MRTLVTSKFPAVVEPKLGDIRADLIFVKPDELLGGGEVIVVELKKYRAGHHVTIETIYQIERLVRSGQFKQGWLMTTGYFTEAVHNYKKDQNWLELFDRDRLVWLFQQHGFRVTTETL